MSNDLYLQDSATRAPTPAKKEEEGLPIGQLVSQVLGLLRKYFWIFILTCAATTSAAYFWTERQPRVYSTSAKIIFHESQSNIFGRGIERVDLMDPGGRWKFEQFWQTQQEILRSSDFAQRVVRRGGFLEDESLAPRTDAKGEPLSEEARMAIAANRVHGSVQTTLGSNSRVVSVKATTTNDPQLAMNLANAYSEAYIDYTREFQSGGLNQMISWFDNYVASKRGELSAAQNQLLSFKRDKEILSVSYEDRQSVTGSNMQMINEQLNGVKAKLAAQESLSRQIQLMEKRGEDMRNLVAFLEEGNALAAAIERETAIKEQLALYRGRGYLDEKPEVRERISELDVVQQHIQEEIARIKSGIRNRTETTRRERARLESELRSLRADAFELDALGVEYGQLKDNAENLKELFQTVLKRSEELDINSMYESDNVQILEEAKAPGSPISPKMPLNLAIGLALGLGLGGACLALIYLLDNTVRSERDITRYTDRPVLGALPAVNANALKGLAQTVGDPLDIITHVAPRSNFAEGIKSLRTNLMFMAPDEPPRLMLVTSPGPSEGKTLICTNMAIAMAQSGLKTIIIDADMRRPRVHKAFGMENGEHGLANLIRGENSVEQAARATLVENLDVISCGPIPPNPSELLHADSMQDLIRDLLQTYDRVLFDSPPLGAVSDALVLSHLIDGIVLITKFGKTRRDLLRRSIEQLVTIGAPLMGCVLNNIDTSVSGYGYANYYYYRYNYDEQPEETARAARKKKRGEAA